MKKPTAKPTEKELEILHIIWEKGPCSVKDVQDALGGDASNGYTTILKFLQIMHEKGLVTRQKSGKMHLYKPVNTSENTQQQLLDKIIETVFKGSASNLVLSALGNKRSTREELKQIRKYLDELEGGE